MFVLQFTGLSGSGKTTLASSLKCMLEALDLKVHIIDGDLFRKTIRDLGFSKEDSVESIGRLFL